jgi:hypothetical protein
VSQERDQAELNDLLQRVGYGLVGDQSGEFDQNVPGAGQRDVASQSHRAGKRPVHHDLSAAVEPRHLRRLRPERLEGDVMRRWGSGLGTA